MERSIFAPGEIVHLNDIFNGLRMGYYVPRE